MGVFSALFGGGGGTKPIYKPQHTELLENMMMAQIMGTMTNQNPAFKNFLGTEPGQKFREKTGIKWQSPAFESVMNQLPLIGGDRESAQGTQGPIRQTIPTDRMYQSLSQPGGRDQGVGQYGLQTPQVDYGRMQRNITGGRLMSGQQIPRYTPPRFDMPQSQVESPGYQQFGFQTPDIKAAPSKVYQDVATRNIEGLQRDVQRFGSQISRDFSGRNLGGSGLEKSKQIQLGGAATEQAAQMRTDLAKQEAQDRLALEQNLGQMDLMRQQLQSGEGQFGFTGNRLFQQLGLQEALGLGGLGLGAATGLGGLGLQSQIGLSDLALRQAGGISALGQGAQQQAMLPYQMLSQLYGSNIGIPSGLPGSSVGIIPATIQATGQIGGAAYGMCLPLGTLIDMDNGTQRAIELVDIGDKVKGGGKVIATFEKIRPLGHQFYSHKFARGEVVMSDEHPYCNDLISKEIVDNDSLTTNDIQTDLGYYYVNGIKLGSTLGGL